MEQETKHWKTKVSRARCSEDGAQRTKPNYLRMIGMESTLPAAASAGKDRIP